MTKKTQQFHIFMTEKGGSGKSTLARLFTMNRQIHFTNVIPLDADGGQSSLSNVQGFQAQKWDISNLSGAEGNYEEIMDNLKSILQKPACYVLDIGAGGTQILGSYILRAGLLKRFVQANYPVVIHTVISTGSELKQSITDVQNLVEAVSPFPIVIWINEKDGEINKDLGCDFFSSDLYLGNKDKGIPALKRDNVQVIDIPHLIGADKVLWDRFRKSNMTFSKVLSSSNPLKLDFFEPEILTELRDDWFSKMDQACIALGIDDEQQDSHDLAHLNDDKQITLFSTSATKKEKNHA